MALGHEELNACMLWGDFDLTSQATVGLSGFGGEVQHLLFVTRRRCQSVQGLGLDHAVTRRAHATTPAFGRKAIDAGVQGGL